MKTNLGGDRLGTGAKMMVDLKTHGKSNKNLSYQWRSSMACGTLVPFLSKVMLPGDSWDIKINGNMFTHPTVGPLFGTYKLQVDVFKIPMRLYNSWIHNNKLNVGMEMHNVKFPQIEFKAENRNYSALTREEMLDLEQEYINSSSVLHLLGYKGPGRFTGASEEQLNNRFNAIPWLCYTDIFKNFYANKQEQTAFVIHTNMNNIGSFEALLVNEDAILEFTDWNNLQYESPEGSIFQLTWNGQVGLEVMNLINLNYKVAYGRYSDAVATVMKDPVISYDVVNDITTIIGQLNFPHASGSYVLDIYGYVLDGELPTYGTVQPVGFPLEDIDAIREKILEKQGDDSFIVNDALTTLTNMLFRRNNESGVLLKNWRGTQEGLYLKTHQSDLFNNWLRTDYLNAITQASRIDVSGGYLTMDSLNIAQKVYNLLTGVAVSGGTYRDWIKTVYSTNMTKMDEIPSYEGGLSYELIFDEVINTAGGQSQPLGTLAGKGRIVNKEGVNKIEINVDEPCYCMGIVSLTPRVCYSQGNSFDMEFDNYNDLHKAELDGIGFQNMMQRQLAWWANGYSSEVGEQKPIHGKVPAWIDYMTSVDESHGNFAVGGNESWMVLNRNYTPWPKDEDDGDLYFGIEDNTTYIDPRKYNNTFAQTSIDSQNFWIMLDIDIFARRVMSEKIIPSL